MTPSPQADRMRARYQAAIAARPAIDPHDLKCAAAWLANAREALREAYKLLRIRDDLAELVERAGSAATAAAGRLEREGTRQ